MRDQFPSAYPRDPEPFFSLVLSTWFENFKKSPEYQSVGKDGNSYAEEIITDLTGFMLYYHDTAPMQWTEDLIEHCLMTDYPRSLFRDDGNVFFIPIVLSSFFRFLGRTGTLPHGAHIANRIEAMSDDFHDQMDDVDLYSMRKSLFIAAEEDGIDPGDYEAVLGYLSDTGDREMAGEDPEVTEEMYSFISTWLVPFSDSREAAGIADVTGSDVIDIVTIMASFLIKDGKYPDRWNPGLLAEFITDFMFNFPMRRKKKEFIVPVLHAFFSYLGEEKLLPKGQEIADTISGLDEKVPCESEDEYLGAAAEIVMKHLMREGIMFDDKERVQKYFDNNLEEILTDMIKAGDPALLNELGKAFLGGEVSGDGHESRTPDLTELSPAQRRWYDMITDMTDSFCHERLDSEYAVICQTVACRLAYMDDEQVRRGKPAIWAAGIIQAVGQMNFLSDPTFEPFQTAEDICLYFGTKKSTTSQKAKLIRDETGMNDLWDPEFSTEYMLIQNPFNKLRLF